MGNIQFSTGIPSNVSLEELEGIASYDSNSTLITSYPSIDCVKIISPPDNIFELSVLINVDSNSDFSELEFEASSDSDENTVLSKENTGNVKSHHFSTLTNRKRSWSQGSDDAYGWFQDFDSPHATRSCDSNDSGYEKQPFKRAISLPSPQNDTPLYVLESSLYTQRLWYETAGKRPKQPENERQYFEKLWRSNFDNSNVNYVDTQKNVKAENIRKFNNLDFEEEVLYKGKCPFSNAVSRSFPEHNIFSTVNIQIPRFKICKNSNENPHAEYLIVVVINGMSFGIWKRHSEFKALALKLEDMYDDKSSNCQFNNTKLSWQCLIHHKKWFKCLDKDYLALKCFLLERFMHDVLFECQTPELITDFLNLYIH
jgi:hypothetical protein